MKLTSRKVPTFGEQRRAGRQNDRLQAPAMRSRYANIAKLQIDLSFAGTSRPPPSPQSHSFFPPARAFFRFACPCSECDGEFDLSASVAELSEVKRPSARTASGKGSSALPRTARGERSAMRRLAAARLCRLRSSSVMRGLAAGHFAWAR